MKSLIFLLFLSLNVLLLNGQDSLDHCKKVKYGIDWTLMLTSPENSKFYTGIGALMTLNKKHQLLIGSVFYIEFRDLSVWFDKPYLRLGYKYMLGPINKKLDFNLVYLSRYRWKKQKLDMLAYKKTGVYPTTVTKSYLVTYQYVGMGIEWHFSKIVSLNFESGLGVGMVYAVYDWEDYYTDRKDFDAILDMFASVGLKYNFKKRK